MYPLLLSSFLAARLYRCVQTESENKIKKRKRKKGEKRKGEKKPFHPKEQKDEGGEFRRKLLSNNPFVEYYHKLEKYHQSFLRSLLKEVLRSGGHMKLLNYWRNEKKEKGIWTNMRVMSNFID